MATITKGKTFVNGELVTPEKIHQLVDAATLSPLVNADIASNAAIADTKLATISTANKVAQSAVANLTTDLAGKAASSHTHTIANVTGLQTALDGKQASGSYAAATHTHAISDTTGLQTALDGKAAASHTHTIANVTGLQTALDGKQASGSYAAATHTHDDRYYTETEVNNLLAGKQFICQFTNDINANTNRPAGSYGSYASSATNTPTGSGILHNFTSGTDGSGDGAQIWQEYVTNRLWARQRWGGNWTAWAEISLAGHTHDDRYYTETEMNTLLDGKQASGSYAPATGIAPSAITGTAVITTDSRLLDARTPTAHTHDDRYYTELEMGTLLSGKANIVHNQSAETITSGTLANARTTATSSNLINTIVARNNFGGIDIALITGVSPGPNSGIYNINTSTGTYIGGILTNSTNTGVIYSTSSDHRLKTDLEKLTGALDRLSALPVHRFKWVGHPAAPKVDGFLAHEAQAVVPESVTGTKDAVDADGKPIYQGIDQSKLVPLLVAAVQELAARVEALEAK
jgi:hypothetical protein